MARGDVVDAGDCPICNQPLISYEGIDGRFHKFPLDAVDCDSDTS